MYNISTTLTASITVTFTVWTKRWKLGNTASNHVSRQVIRSQRFVAQRSLIYVNTKSNEIKYAKLIGLLTNSTAIRNTPRAWSRELLQWNIELYFFENQDRAVLNFSTAEQYKCHCVYGKFHTGARSSYKSRDG